MRKGFEIRAHEEPHAPAVASVTPVRTALGNELLPPEVHGPWPPVAGGNLDQGFVDEPLHAQGWMLTSFLPRF